MCGQIKTVIKLGNEVLPLSSPFILLKRNLINMGLDSIWNLVCLGSRLGSWLISCSLKVRILNLGLNIPSSSKFELALQIFLSILNFQTWPSNLNLLFESSNLERIWKNFLTPKGKLSPTLHNDGSLLVFLISIIP